MRKMLNVLYVTTPEAYLARDGDNVVVKLQQKEVFRTPIHYLEGIVVFNYVGASPSLLGICAERGVSITFLSPSGKFLASLSGPIKGNVLLRRRQYRIADSESDSCRFASRFIFGKVVNCRGVLRRFLSDHGSSDTNGLQEAIKSLAASAVRIHKSGTIGLEELRGIEGEAAKTYFGQFDRLVLYQKESFFMNARNRRPPTDNLNAMLSFLYMLLNHETRSALETVGLDPYVGFLHRDRPGRPGLALDLMEEFRPYLVDRLALTLINRRQVSASDFVKKESGAVVMSDNARRTLLDAWQQKKREQIRHPYLDENIPIGLLPYAQALLLARCLRGDLDDYIPFLSR